MRKVLQQLGQYKRDTFRCIGLTALEENEKDRQEVYNREKSITAAGAV